MNGNARKRLACLAGRVFDQTRTFRHDCRGSTAILMAILFPVVIGGMGLGAETGYWYMKQRMLQHVADVGAYAGASRKRAGDSVAKIEAAVHQVATVSGHRPGEMEVHVPPTSGRFAGDADSVEVIVRETYPRLFSVLFGNEPVVVAGRAVAQVGTVGTPSKACVLALSVTAPGAVTISGSTAPVMNGCDIASNSVADNSFDMSGSSTATTTCVQSVGGTETTSGLDLTNCEEVRDYAPEVIDPYASVPEPAVVGACSNPKVGHTQQATTLTPVETHPSGVKSMRFCKGLDVKGAVTFEPGLYIIEGGDFTINGGTLNATSAALMNGAGVTFYLAPGVGLKLTGDVTMNLSAPTSGPYSGLLFFGSRAVPGREYTINGSSGSVLQGAVYGAASHIKYSGGTSSSGANGCTQIIGDTVTFIGSSTIGSECDMAGTRDIVTNVIVALVE